MSDEGRDRFEIPKEMRSMAEAGFDQARKTFEHLLATAQQAASTLEGRNEAARAGAKEISAKAVAFAEANVQTSLEYAEKLLKVKDLGELMRLQSEHVQAQMKSLAQQASDMGQLMGRTALDAARPKT